MFHYSMKRQIFNFYATPLNIWSIVGFMFLAMICSGIINEVFFAPAYGIESTSRFISRGTKTLLEPLDWLQIGTLTTKSF